MSSHKCFYCESKIKGFPKEIDHYIEVVEKPELAFSWENLYLSCPNCNDKIPNKDIPITDALNPCEHKDTEIEEHLAFEDEEIIAQKGSLLGLKTIQKFRLDSETLDRLRGKQLHLFHGILLQIKNNQLKEKRDNMTDDELQSLKTFAQPDKPFSLMFRLLLKKYHIL